MQRQQCADVERLQRVIGPEDMVDDEHLALEQGAKPHRLAAARRERIRPVDRARSQLVDVKVTGAQVKQSRPKLVLAGRVILLDKADALERPQDAVGGAAGQAERIGDLADPQPPRAVGQ